VRAVHLCASYLAAKAELDACNHALCRTIVSLDCSRSLVSMGRGDGPARDRMAELVAEKEQQLADVMSAAVRLSEEWTAFRMEVERMADPEHRALLSLVHLEGMSVHEAARSLHMPSSTAKDRYREAMAALDRDMRRFDKSA